MRGCTQDPDPPTAMFDDRQPARTLPGGCFFHAVGGGADIRPQLGSPPRTYTYADAITTVGLGWSLTDRTEPPCCSNPGSNNP